MCIGCVNAMPLQHFQIASDSVAVSTAASHSPMFRADESRDKAVAKVDNDVKFFSVQGFNESQSAFPTGMFASVVVNVNGIDLRFGSEECGRARPDKEGNVGLRKALPERLDDSGGEHGIANEGETEDEDFHLMPNFACVCPSNNRSLNQLHRCRQSIFSVELFAECLCAFCHRGIGEG